MELAGLDYNTLREKLKLKAYGREIQQMVELAVALPEKSERQKAAETIINVMRHIVPSQQSMKERMPVLWYHLALMSDFKLDIDYPVEIVQENEMEKKPTPLDYKQSNMPPKHYGRLIFMAFDQLAQMEPGEERDALVSLTAAQMYRNLMMWGSNSSAEKIASDLARYTNGVIQVDPADLRFENKNNKKKKKK